MRNENRELELEAELKRLRGRVSELESRVEGRREVEKTLRDQIQFLQVLIDTIPNAIFFKDKDGKYLGCNKAFERRIGLDRAASLENRPLTSSRKSLPLDMSSTTQSFSSGPVKKYTKQG